MLTLLLAATLTLPPQKTEAVVGVYAIHLQSGRTVGVRENERFPMGSVYKFPIALAVLKRVDSGTLQLDREVTIEPKDFAPGWSPLRDEAGKRPITLTVRELLGQMVAVSDNTASDALLRLVGGPTAVTTRMAELGFSGIRIDRSETQMARDLDEPGGVERYAIDARDTSSPRAMAELLAAFWRRKIGLSLLSHDLLLEWMTETTTGPRRLTRAIPGTVVAHKTGTMPGTANDAGVVVTLDDEVIVVVFTKRGFTSSLKDREDDLAAAARAAYDAVVVERE
jgi:beta-lactamase class A